VKPKIVEKETLYIKLQIAMKTYWVKEINDP
jgi:hypothetical protein